MNAPLTMLSAVLAVCVVVLLTRAAGADAGLPGPSPRAGWPVAEPRVTIRDAVAGFSDREARLLRQVARQPGDKPADDLYGNRAIACLVLGLAPQRANAQLRWVAQWFDHPHPNGRPHRGESDFAALRLARAYRLFERGPRGQGAEGSRAELRPATLEAIRAFFLEHNFQSRYDSENHHLIFHVSRYLMGDVYRDAVFEAWAQTGAQLAEIDAAWIERFIVYRAGHGWGEFDSSCYIRPDMEALLCLYDFAPSDRLRKLAGMSLDLLLADMSVDSLRGMIGGAQGRIYAGQALDHADANT